MMITNPPVVMTPPAGVSVVCFVKIESDYAVAGKQSPWFRAYALAWDVSTEEPIDKETANASLETNRDLYTALAYFFCE